MGYLFCQKWYSVHSRVKGRTFFNKWAKLNLFLKVKVQLTVTLLNALTGNTEYKHI